MSIAYVTSFDWLYRELAGDHPLIPGIRKIDVQPNDPLLDWKNIVVYLEYHAKDPNDVADLIPTGYTGRFIVRKIAQSCRGYVGVHKNAVLLLVEEYAPTEVEETIIKAQVTDIMVRSEKVDGMIVPPRSISDLPAQTALSA